LRLRLRPDLALEDKKIANGGNCSEINTKAQNAADARQTAEH